MEIVFVKLGPYDKDGNPQNKVVQIGKPAYDQFMKDGHSYYEGSKIVSGEDVETVMQTAAQDHVAELEKQLTRAKAALKKQNAAKDNA